MKTLTTLAVALIALVIAPGSALAYNYDLICDVSGSMSAKDKQRQAAGAGLYVVLAAPTGASGHIGAFPRFTSGATPVVLWQGLRKTDKDQLLADVRLGCRRRGGGPTPLYQAIEAACVDLAGLDKPRHLVVFSDMGNTDGADKLATAVAACTANDVVVNTVRIGKNPFPSAVDDPGGDADATQSALEGVNYSVAVTVSTTDVHVAVRKILQAMGVPSLSLVGMAAFAVLLVGIGTFFVLRRRTSTA